ADRQQDYLNVACGSDHELRQYVAGLLDAERQAGSFLDHPAVEDAVNRIAARAASSPPVSGTQLGGYSIGGQIGVGGMGTVYEARDTRLGRKVAIKLLPPAFSGDPDRIARFQQEARVISLLNHPNIVSIYDAELEQGRCYIATEFVEGKTLRQLIDARTIDLRLFLDIAIQTCSALAAAHQAGIVHRDIKPENVMVRPDGLVKVLDFGLAKLADPIAVQGSQDYANRPPAFQSIPGIIAGTVQYLAPEQVLGRAASPQSDIFSLGVTLYELATGGRPFAGPSDAAVLAAIVNQTPVHPSVLRPSLGAELDALMMRTLEKDPELRVQTANDLRSALKLLARGSQPGAIAAALPASAPVPARGLMGRWRAWGLAILAAIGASVCVAGWFLSRSPAPTVAGQFTRLTDSPTEESYPSLTPDGDRFLYAGAARGKWDIYLQRTGGNTGVNLTADSPDDDSEPALSRDGLRIAFRSERGGGGLFVMESTGENPTRIASRGHLPAWSPDGKSIVYSDDTFTTPSDRATPVSRLHVIDLASGAQRELATGDAVQPNWSPHGDRIAYWGIRRGGQRDIWTVAAVGDAPVKITDDQALDWNPVWSPNGEELYFLSDRGGSMNVWRVKIDERSGQIRGEPQPFIVPASYVQFLNWAANGKRFVFSQAERRVALFSIAFDRARMDVAGEPVQSWATLNDITNFSFSPDGSEIVSDTVGDPHEDLWISKIDGSGRRRLVGGGLNRVPQWSPNGDTILFYSNRGGLYDLWLIHPDGGGLRQLTAVTTAGHEMQGSSWIDKGNRILASRQVGGPSILDPRAGVPVIDPPGLPGFAGEQGDFIFLGRAVNEVLLGRAQGGGNPIVRYSVASGKPERLGIAGDRPVWVPGSNRQLIYKRDGACYLYDLDLRSGKKLFSVAPNQIYTLQFDPAGRRLYFTEAIRDANLWMGQMNTSR
ncbi:MAG TPA: protein kinase, partial [Bryobacteraceae bacterium]